MYEDLSLQQAIELWDEVSPGFSPSFLLLANENHRLEEWLTKKDLPLNTHENHPAQVVQLYRDQYAQVGPYTFSETPSPNMVNDLGYNNPDGAPGEGYKVNYACDQEGSVASACLIKVSMDRIGGEDCPPRARPVVRGLILEAVVTRPDCRGALLGCTLVDRVFNHSRAQWGWLNAWRAGVIRSDSLPLEQFKDEVKEEIAPIYQKVNAVIADPTLAMPFTQRELAFLTSVIRMDFLYREKLGLLPVTPTEERIADAEVNPDQPNYMHVMDATKQRRIWDFYIYNQPPEIAPEFMLVKPESFDLTEDIRGNERMHLLTQYLQSRDIFPFRKISEQQELIRFLFESGLPI